MEVSKQYVIVHVKVFRIRGKLNRFPQNPVEGWSTGQERTHLTLARIQEFFI